jgi:putative DNA primase/helicase
MRPAEDFRHAIHAGLGIDPGPVLMDGRIHRFNIKGRGRDKAGWYKGYDDGFPAGAFGDWRTGSTEKWCARSPDTVSPDERQAQRDRLAEIKRRREAERAAEIERAAKKAEFLWRAAKPADENHPYLACKVVKPHGIRQLGDTLVVPVRRAGRLTSLQFISPDGEKRFLRAGEVAGGFHALGRDTSAFVICEGYATAATIHETTGRTVVAAFHAGNLKDATAAMRAKFPEAEITLAADDDHETPGNPGLAKAKAAAAENDAIVAVPSFDRGAGEAGSDWNDFAALHGADATRKAFKAAVASGALPAVAMSQLSQADEPLPLAPPAAGPQPYPVAALGTVLADAARSIAAKTQCAPAMAAQSVLAVASLAAQRLADVRLPYGRGLSRCPRLVHI